LRNHPLQKGRRIRGFWWRKHTPATRLASCFILITLATVFVWLFERSEPTVNLIWVANGLLLTYLLLAPRWRWPAYLMAGAAAMIFSSALIGEPWQINLVYNVLNLVEVLIGALLLRKKSTQLPRFTDRRYLARFIGYAVLAGPIASGAILTPVMTGWTHTAPLKVFLDWTVADGLGAAIIVPTFVAIFATRFRNSASLRRHWHYPAVLAAVTVVSFSQDRMPLFILIFPVLVLLLMRLGLGWAALATLLIAAIAGWYTLHNSGPFAVSSSAYAVATIIQVQFFFACCIFMIYIVSVVMQERNSTEFRLQEIASVHELVTDNSRDVILLADLDGRHTYVSPAVESMKGWKPGELLNRRLSEQVHPDDREKVEDAVFQLRHGSDGAILEYRAQKRNGEYIWVESSLRMFRDRRTGIPAGILSLVRDITERKRNEGLLLEAYRQLEELAVVDALTGVANRRRFDEYLANEWSSSARLQIPISLLLIDADALKQHNDLYGHLRGDDCLKQIAEAATRAANRPKDLTARFGGDEFAVILPGTDAAGAVEVGCKIKALLKGCGADHEENTLGPVTISIGCATAIPKSGNEAAALIQAADELLYMAKRNGRDQLCHNLIAPPDLDVGYLIDSAGSS
jgi:diguanylate cyclase (GGDEF)-like protein/PAS domain S-box-containing protein